MFNTNHIFNATNCYYMKYRISTSLQEQCYCKLDWDKLLFCMTNIFNSFTKYSITLRKHCFLQNQINFFCWNPKWFFLEWHEWNVHQLSSTHMERITFQSTFLFFPVLTVNSFYFTCFYARNLNIQSRSKNTYMITHISF